MRRKNTFNWLIYSFPVQLLILHLRKNQLLLLCWIFLFSVVTGSFGKLLGIPYLFLDPEYLGKVGFSSFFIIGITVGGFTMAYHITCYILDGTQFNFLGTLRRPFSKFAVNNSIIPIVFILVYLLQIINFQFENEYDTGISVALKVIGFLCGFSLMSIFLLAYFWFTNKDIFRIVASTFDKRLKMVTITRARALSKLKEAKEKKPRVDYYFDHKLKWRKIPATTPHYEKQVVLKVFDQNHLNSVIIELVIFVVILMLGMFRDNPVFQIPAAASVVLFLTIVIMLAGAFSFWLRGWATSTIILVFFLLNFLAKEGVFSNSYYKAYGLDYQSSPASYTLKTLDSLNSAGFYQEDKAHTIEMLENWRSRMTRDYLLEENLSASEKKPKMVMICTSGGGLRSALWTTSVLQRADSVTHGKLMDHARLITGASGGLIGAAYFRELALRKKLQQEYQQLTPTLVATRTGHQTSIYNREYLEKIAKDNLNPVIFTLLVNDLFVKHQRFIYNGQTYTKDRGYAFEEQLNINTEYILDKRLEDYKIPEQLGLTPMLLITPAIVNDGRKLFISPHPISYMNTNPADSILLDNYKIKGVDFQRFFSNHEAGSLRFLSALRMNATFPYVTPNVTLPVTPEIQIMDAGIADNFGIGDAVHFMYVFREWIAQNTSGVIMVCIRDSQKLESTDHQPSTSLLQRFSAPFRFLYDNIFNIQDMNHDDRIEYAQTWFKGKIHRIDFEYIYKPVEGIHNLGDLKPGTRNGELKEWAKRPSLSWRLTTREKESLISNINHPQNQEALMQLKRLLDE